MSNEAGPYQYYILSLTVNFDNEVKCETDFISGSAGNASGGAG